MLSRRFVYNDKVCVSFLAGFFVYFPGAARNKIAAAKRLWFAFCSFRSLFITACADACAFKALHTRRLSYVPLYFVARILYALISASKLGFEVAVTLLHLAAGVPF